MQPPTKEDACFHCGLPIPAAAKCQTEIKGVQRTFCCAGCLTVCRMIHDTGLEEFYRRNNYQESQLPPPEMPVDLDQYDLEEVQAEFVRSLANGIKEANLLVEGIHCAACVWLIEHALGKIDGIHAAEVNLAHQRVLVRWDSKTLRLSSIMQQLGRLGYAAAPFNPEAAEGSMQRSNRALLFRMAFAGFGVLNIMWISIALYAGAFTGIDIEHKQFFHWTSLVIATPVLAYSGWPFFRSAWLGLFQRQLTMDLPIAIGSAVTYLYSAWVTWRQSGEVYFDTVVTFLFFILVGRYLEGLSKRNASSAALRLMELQPRLATLLGADGEQRISVRKLKAGDQVLVRPGEKIPADGKVLHGHSHVDESMLSGESHPVRKEVGSQAIAGTINMDGSLTLSVEDVGNNTVLAKIVHLVEVAQGSKAAVQRVADRIVPWFVAATLGLATLTFLYWARHDLNLALLAAVSVLIITCPCALGLATPMAIAVGVGAGSKRGVLVRNGQALESLSKITHVVFDKTGTLTEGRMQVVETLPTGGFDHARLLMLAAAVESQSQHPLAQAITKAYTKQSRASSLTAVQLPRCNGFSIVPGMGVKGSIAASQVAIGNLRLMQKAGADIPQELKDEQLRIERAMGVGIMVAVDGRLAGLIHIQDKVRDQSADLINTLRTQGLGLTLLTGDSRGAAEQLQSQLGEMNIVAEVMPDEKELEIIRLQDQGERVLMIGDGINDAPALARADVSMAMGSGMDVSMECADIILMNSELERISFAFLLARKTLRTIYQNISISLLYNLILVPAAMAAMVTPVFAAIAMPLSSLLVIGNAVLIHRRVAG